MKKLLSILILSFLICSNAFADIDGLFSGELIYPNGDTFPMVSEFKTNNESVVWGKYLWIQNNKEYEGVFYKGKLEGSDLKISWSDDYGEGWLKVKFNEKFESFKGEWGMIKDNVETRKEGNWTGARSQ